MKRVHLPGYVSEPGFADGDGPAWIAAAIGATPGTTITARAYMADDGEHMALVLNIAGRELMVRPARLVGTRWLAEILSACGFPVPYYSPPQLALLGQAIARLALRDHDAQEESMVDEFTSVVADWLGASLEDHHPAILTGRAGADVRAAISHVRGPLGGRWNLGLEAKAATAPLIVEPARGVLLAWRVPVAAHVRLRLGTAHDAVISLQLQRAGLARGRLDARPGPGQSGTIGLPVWETPNGWQGIEAPIPHGA